LRQAVRAVLAILAILVGGVFLAVAYDPIHILLRPTVTNVSTSIWIEAAVCTGLGLLFLGCGVYLSSDDGN
jgi:hypothetical protein